MLTLDDPYIYSVVVLCSFKINVCIPTIIIMCNGFDEFLLNFEALICPSVEKLCSCTVKKHHFYPIQLRTSNVWV